MLSVIALDDNETLPDTEVLGQQLASILITSVKTGSVEYIGGNDYKFTEAQHFPYTE